MFYTRFGQPHRRLNGSRRKLRVEHDRERRVMLSNVFEHLHIDVAVRSRVGNDDVTAVTAHDGLKLAPARDRRESVPRAKNDPKM